MFYDQIGMSVAWETLCKATEVAESDDDRDPTVLAYQKIQKENEIQPATMHEVRKSVGHDRESWRLAMQVEVESLRDNQSFEVASESEVRGLNPRKILPMKLVVGTKRDTINKTEKKKARAVICGNFQEKTANEELYTATADITSVRAALAASVPRKFDAKVIDIKTAFLNAKLPDQMETVFARPPQALVDFGLVQPGEIWKVQKAIYGLRGAPTAGGVERDAVVRRLALTSSGEVHHLRQSHIDPSVWTIVKGAIAPEGAGRPERNAKPEDVVGYLVVYVDDFLILGLPKTIDAVTVAIKSVGKITDNPTLKWGSGLTVEYLSVEIAAVENGWHLSQATYCKDLLAKWGMEECRAIGSLEDVGEEVREEDEPSPDDVHKAQRLAGGLNWLATRTRPDISFVVSQLSSVATRAPLRAIAFGQALFAIPCRDAGAWDTHEIRAAPPRVDRSLRRTETPHTKWVLRTRAFWWS